MAEGSVLFVQARFYVHLRGIIAIETRHNEPLIKLLKASYGMTQTSQREYDRNGISAKGINNCIRGFTDDDILKLNQEVSEQKRSIVRLSDNPLTQSFISTQMRDSQIMVNMLGLRCDALPSTKLFYKHRGALTLSRRMTNGLKKR